eukprot:Nitzschia sp. Nitz4//scaffold325_size20118//460//1276//NITZ4_008700-RA/size20118-snap-gene-0.32-mRNA-1//1//CDS//3329547893//6895//frame0
MDVVDQEIIDKRGKQGLYSGTIDKTTGFPHGQGRMEYDDESYEGQWIAGDWEGFGKHTSDFSGETYEGGFLDYKRHGSGVLRRNQSSDLYCFTFQEDHINKSKKGDIFFLDGSAFWGFINDDIRPHGRGKLKFSNGNVYDGEFVDGKMEGHGKMEWADGRWYLGEWVDGKKNGLGLEVSADGTLSHEGTFCNNRPLIASSFPKKSRSEGDILVYRTGSFAVLMTR